LFTDRVMAIINILKASVDDKGSRLNDVLFEVIDQETSPAGFCLFFIDSLY